MIIYPRGDYVRSISFLEIEDSNNTYSKLLSKEFQFDSVVVFKSMITDHKKFIFNDTEYLHYNIKFSPEKYLPCRDLNILLKLEPFKSNFFLVYSRFENKGLFKKNYYHLDIIFKKYIAFALDLIQNPSNTIISFTDIPHTALEYSFYIVAKALSVKIIYFILLPKLISQKHHNYLISDSYETLDFNFNDNTNKTIELSSLNSSFKEYYYEYFINHTELIVKENSDNKVLLYPEKFTEILRRFVINILFNIIHFRFYYILAKIFSILVIIPIERIIIKHHLNIYKTKFIPSDKKIIYIPLHYQPEATSIPSGNIYYDQLIIINTLSKAINDDWCIVVKEHPVLNKVRLFDKPEFYHPFRSKSFYMEINSFKNTILVEESFDSGKLINLSNLVVTIRGTVIFEAFGMGKKVLALGDSFYNSFPNVIRLNEGFFNLSALKELVDETIDTDDSEFRDLFLRYLYLLQTISLEVEESDKKFNSFYSKARIVIKEWVENVQKRIE